MIKTKQVGVELLGEPDDRFLRYVVIENEGTVDQQCEQVFVNGQNDRCPVDGRRSVSVGDTFSIQGQWFMVDRVGFLKLTNREWLRLTTLLKEDQQWWFKNSDGPAEERFIEAYARTGDYMPKEFMVAS